MISKPKIEVFSPAEVCECSFAAWANNVWNILMNYKDKLEIFSLTSDSPRALELGVGGRIIVVNGEITPVFLLDQKIRDALKQSSSSEI